MPPRFCSVSVALPLGSLGARKMIVPVSRTCAEEMSVPVSTTIVSEEKFLPLTVTVSPPRLSIVCGVIEVIAGAPYVNRRGAV